MLGLLHRRFSLQRRGYACSCGSDIPAACRSDNFRQTYISGSCSNLITGFPTNMLARKRRRSLRREDSSAMRNWSSSSGSDSGSGCARVLVRLMVARFGSSMPFVSKQYAVPVFARILWPRCRPQLHGHLRAGDYLSPAAGSKQRRARRRGHAVRTAFPTAGSYLRSQSVCTLLLRAAPPRKSSVQSRLALSERDCKLRVRDPTDSIDCFLLTVQRLGTNQLRRSAW